MSKPETLVIKRVRDGLVRSGFTGIHLDKTNNPYVSGWLDLYVEAAGGFTGWIEAKYRPAKYEAGSVVSTAPILKMLSELQAKRANRHHKNGVPVAVLCGFAGSGPRERTYTFITPAPLQDIDDLVWPGNTRVVDIGALCTRIYNWIYL